MKLESVFSGRVRPRYTLAGAGLFVAGRIPDLRRALEAAGLKPGERFLDLGSGDGRVVFLASEMGAQATGIEADESLHRRACQTKVKWGRSGRRRPVKFVLGDFLDVSFEKADVIFYYAGGAPRRQNELYAKLEHEMHPGARLIVHRTAREPALRLPLHPDSRPPDYFIYRAGLGTALTETAGED